VIWQSEVLTGNIQRYIAPVLDVLQRCRANRGNAPAIDPVANAKTQEPA
jgi:hypothetical protein